MLSRFLGLLLLASTLGAQCQKPPIPETGLPVRAEPDLPVVYSDGSRTTAELLLPSMTPPACRWPLVVYVHGLSANRRANEGERRFLASQGYAVWAYDVRGQGDHAQFNRDKTAATFDGGAEHVDLAEQILFARQRFAPWIGTPVAVIGPSQGGAHAWAAAAFSEQILDAPGRPRTQFPRIDAVVPTDLAPEPIRYRVKDRTQFHAAFTNLLFSGSSSLRIDPSQIDVTLRGFLAQDPELTARILEAEPGRAVLPLLLQTRVPILCAHSWLDAVVSAGPLLDLWFRLPATTPRRLLLHTTGIHNSPPNEVETEYLIELRLRWLDRFLWHVPDPVEREAPVVVSLLPTEPKRLGHPRTLWQRRHLGAWPTPNLRLHLDAGGTLSPVPVGPGQSPIVHAVHPGLTPANYVLYPPLRTPGAILALAPLEEVSFRSTPLADDVELIGTPQVSLAIRADAPRFTISAALYARLPGRSDRFQLCSDSRMVRAGPAGMHRVELTLNPIGVLLPRQTELELVLRNHWLLEPPYTPTLGTTPEFTPGTMRVLHGPEELRSSIDLPIRPVQPGLTSPVLAMPASRPLSVPLHIDGGRALALAPYVVVAGASGHAPVGLVPAVTLDALSHLLLGIGNSPVTQNFVGLLDPLGRATAVFAPPPTSPLPPVLIGARLSFAGVLFGRSGVAGTNAVDTVVY